MTMTETEMQEFSDHVRDARQRHNLSQNEFGDMLGVTGSSIANWEVQRYQPSERVRAEVNRLIETLDNGGAWEKPAEPLRKAAGRRRKAAAAAKRSRKSGGVKKSKAAKTEWGDRLENVRLELGITAAAMASRIGVSESNYYRYLSGTATPSGTVLGALEFLEEEATAPAPSAPQPEAKGDRQVRRTRAKREPGVVPVGGKPLFELEDAKTADEYDRAEQAYDRAIVSAEVNTGIKSAAELLNSVTAGQLSAVDPEAVEALLEAGVRVLALRQALADLEESRQ